MARRPPAGTRVPGADVLLAADAFNGVEDEQARAAAERVFASHQTIHLAGSGCAHAPVETYGGSSTASVIAVFDHPAMCQVCVRGREALREKFKHVKHVKHQAALRPHLAAVGSR